MELFICTNSSLLIAHLGDDVIINSGYLLFWPSQSRLASLQFCLSIKTLSSKSRHNFLVFSNWIWGVSSRSRYLKLYMESRQLCKVLVDPTRGFLRNSGDNQPNVW